MKLALVLLVVYLVAGVLAVVLARRKRRCPECRQRTLAPDDGASLLAKGNPGFRLDAYRCTACGSEWRNYNDRGLISKQAYDEGAREPPPEAKVKAKR